MKTEEDLKSVLFIVKITSPNVSIPNGGDSGVVSQAASSSSLSYHPESLSSGDIGDAKNTKLPIISLQEVSQHFSPDDAWMVIYDRVYNFTKYLNDHPGGYDIMYEYIGFDGTVAFRGTGHSKKAFVLMEPFLIGILPENERIYTDKLKW